MPKLSIITINLNNASGLQKTIESVISQQSQAFDFIIIDGGSSDGSKAVIEKYRDKIHYWVSEPDRGIYAAMNKGIRVATGDYLQFLNSGDYLLSPNVTDRMLHNMPDCSIVYGNKLRENNGKLKIDKSYAGRQITFLDLYISTIYHACAYIKRSLFEKYGLYDETLNIVSDWKFYLLAVGLNNESVAYCDIDMVWFDPSGISSTQKTLDKIERKQVINEIVPTTIRLDYEQFVIDGQIICRLKKSRLSWLIVRTLYRLIFRIDKLLKHNE